MDTTSQTNAEDYRKLIAFAVLVWIVATIGAVNHSYPNIMSWQLGDNDNYMRLHQVETFLETKSWYQKPLEDFNPQDGRIMHWSRIPDLPIAASILLLGTFLDDPKNILATLFIIPSIYSLLFIISIGIFTYRFFNINIALTAIFITPFVAAYAKFLPGNIDHHGLQIVIFSVFLATLPIKGKKLNRNHLVFNSIAITLSLLIGLEVLPFIVIVLITLLVSNVNDEASYDFICVTSFSSSILGIIGLLTLEGFSGVTSQNFDTASSSLFILIFFCGFILYANKKIKLLLFLVIQSIVFLTLVYLVQPDLISSPYRNYPAILNDYWLEKVMEARPFYVSIQEDHISLMNVFISITTIIPIFSIIIKKVQHIKLVYISFIFSLLLVYFWQIRTILFSSILALPLMANIAYLGFNRMRTPVVRMLPIALSLPFATSILVYKLISEPRLEDQVKSTAYKIETLELINTSNIINKKIMTSVEVGAILLALSDNSIISAPYHRNINGNLLSIESFISHDIKSTLRALHDNRIDYIIVDKRDPHIKILSDNSTNHSLINLLLNNKPPNGISVMTSNNNLTIYSL